MAITRGSIGALSTAVTVAPSFASAQVQPPGEAPRSRQVSPGAGCRLIRVSPSQSFR